MISRLLAPPYVEWASFVATIAPQDSTLASKLFLLAVQGSGALLSSNLEEPLYKLYKSP